MASWSKDSLLTFIEKFRSLECLWKVKSKDYFKTFLKDKAYDSLIKFTKSFDSGINRDSIIKKINNLRSSFRRELKKYAQSKLSGAGREDLYQPKLWYFDNLMFLRDQESPRETISNIAAHEDELNSRPDSPNSLVPPSPTLEGEAAEGEELLTVSPTTSSPAPIVIVSTSSQKAPVANKSKPSKKRNAAIDDELLAAARRKLLNTQPTTQEDEFDILGKHIAHRLRKLSLMQQIHAKKAINYVLFEAELNEISRRNEPNPESVRNSSGQNANTCTNEIYGTYQQSYHQYPY